MCQVRLGLRDLAPCLSCGQRLRRQTAIISPWLPHVCRILEIQARKHVAKAAYRANDRHAIGVNFEHLANPRHQIVD